MRELCCAGVERMASTRKILFLFLLPGLPVQPGTMPGTNKPPPIQSALYKSL